ncbi:MAG TPA: hypothetical protein VK604_26730, partial [Bryobacteraceae bacterium]|nr:hypothetical protein [Bryobacteraceae bacterium]
STDALVKKLEELAPEKAPDAPAAPALTNIGAQLIASVMSMQGSEMPPTAVELEACKKEESAYITLMAKWSTLKGAPKQ